MRSFWLGCLTASASLAVAATLLAINSAFEVAGSIPDVEQCGFLAGNLGSLLFIYPIACVLIGRKAAGFGMSRWPDESEEIIRGLTFAGWVGGSLYFGAGVSRIAARTPVWELPAVVWIAMGAYVALCGLGMRVGTLMCLASRRSPA